MNKREKPEGYRLNFSWHLLLLVVNRNIRRVGIGARRISTNKKRAGGTEGR
jgi:hypothetical protein